MNGKYSEIENINNFPFSSKPSKQCFPSILNTKIFLLYQYNLTQASCVNFQHLWIEKYNKNYCDSTNV